MFPVRKGQSWLPTIFNDFLGNEWVTKMNSAAPEMNIMECEERYRVEIAAPGMTKDDFTVEIKNDNQLVVTMEKKGENMPNENSTAKEEPKSEGECACGSDCGCTGYDGEQEHRNGKYLRREFTYSHFRQTLVLPENVDKTKITAKQENGILTIFIPKKESVIEAQATKKIAVQ